MPLLSQQQQQPQQQEAGSKTWKQKCGYIAEQIKEEEAEWSRNDPVIFSYFLLFLVCVLFGLKSNSKFVPFFITTKKGEQGEAEQMAKTQNQNEEHLFPSQLS